MRGRWSLGVLVAIVVAIAVATSGPPSRLPAEARVYPPMDVTLALQSEGIELRVAHDGLVLAFRF